MKPLSLNMSKMKKVGGDKHTSTFKHEDGHMITIMHAKLPALQRKQLEKLEVQHLDEGGMAVTSPGSALDKGMHKAFKTPYATPSSTPGNSDSDHAKKIRESYGYKGSLSDNQQTTSYAEGGKVPPPPDDVTKSMRKAFHFAEGTPDEPINASKLESQYEAEDNTAQGNPPADTGQAWANEIGKDIPNVDPNAQVASQPAPASAPVADSAPQASSSTPEAKTPKTSGTTDISKAFQQGQKAISEQQDVDTHKAQANADLLQADDKARQELSDKFNQNIQQIQDHQKQYMNDYMNNHIDPRHYQESLSTGQKVVTAIGLLLGAGGGEMGNGAMKFLNEQVDRDIKAQESRLGQQKTLLEANHNLFGDALAANTATRINMNEMLDHRIQLAAAKLGTPQAEAAANAAHSNLTFERKQLLEQTAIRKTVLDAAKTGGKGLDAIDLAHAGLVSPEVAEKEQASVDAQKSALASVDSIYDRMDKEQTVGNVLNLQSHERMTQLKAELTNVILNSSASKRLNPEFVKSQVEPLATKLLENKQTRGNAHQTLRNIIKEHADPTPNLQKYAPGSLPRYTAPSLDQQALVWARMHPKDQRSAAIKQRLGVK